MYFILFYTIFEVCGYFSYYNLRGEIKYIINDKQEEYLYLTKP